MTSAGTTMPVLLPLAATVVSNVALLGSVGISTSSCPPPEGAISGEKALRAGRGGGLEPALLLRDPRGLDPGPCAGLADRRRQVVAHRPLRQEQPAGDVGHGRTVG